MVQAGIPFVSQENLPKLMDKLQERQDSILQKKNSTAISVTGSSTPPKKQRVELRRIEDKNFHARTMASLREWLDAAIATPQSNNNHNNHDNNDDNPEMNHHPEEGASFLLPPCNAFLRRALYETIPNGA